MTDVSTGILAILQARTSSSRLPGKVLAPLLGRPMILHQIDRIRRAVMIDRLIVATTDDASDDELATLLNEEGIEVYRGSKDDVLSRFIGVLNTLSSDPLHVVRLTGDCPLTDPSVIDNVVRRHLMNASDFTSNVLAPTYPDGLDVEVVRSDILRSAAAEAKLRSEREHVMPFIWSRPARFRLTNVCAEVDYSRLRWTVDTDRDLEFVREIYNVLFPINARFVTGDIIKLMEDRPEILDINGGQTRNEGYAKSLVEDDTYE